MIINNSFSFKILDILEPHVTKLHDNNKIYFGFDTEYLPNNDLLLSQLYIKNFYCNSDFNFDLFSDLLAVFELCLISKIYSKSISKSPF
jgi:hypothetical protein